MEQVVCGSGGLALSPPLFDGADGAQHPCHLQDLSGSKAGAQLCPLQGAGAVLNPTQSGGTVPVGQRIDIGGTLQGIAGIVIVVAGLQLQRQFPAGGAGRLLCQHFQHTVKLQCAVMFIHGSPPFGAFR